MRSLHRALAVCGTALAAISAVLPTTTAAADNPEAGSPYGSAFVVQSPKGDMAWSSSGIAPVVSSAGTGKFAVRFPGITGTFGVATVSAAPGVPASTCAVDAVGITNGAATVSFHCSKATGALSNTGFAVSYTSDPIKTAWGTFNLPNSFVPLPASDAYNWKGLSVLGTQLVAGSTTVSFGGLAGPSTLLLTSARGPGARHCGVSELAKQGADIAAGVNCVDPATGQAVDSGFTAHLVQNEFFRAAFGTTGWVRIGKPFSITAAKGTVGVSDHHDGTYTATFHQLIGNGPILAHVQAGGTWGRCNAWPTRSGTDVSVAVRCFNAAGQLATMPFDLVVFAAK